MKGYVRGFDVRTGKRLWIFHTIPRPGEFGNDTWVNDSWAYTGNAGVWAQMTVDEELGIVYLPVELPTGDYYGGHRPGNNLFGESLVALDLKTGKRKWHYQLVHHGIWDCDIPCAPILADITVERPADQGGRAADQAGLALRVRSRHRAAGLADRRAAGRERRRARRVVRADAAVPDQAAAVRSAGRLDRRSDRLHAGAARRSRRSSSRATRSGRSSRRRSSASGKARSATLMLPSPTGGANWQGGSFDPETNIFYIFSITNVVSALGLINDPERVGHGLHPRARAPIPTAPPPGGRRTAVAARAAAAAVTVQGLPLIKPPYGRITAIDLNKGEIVWQIAHGETPDNIRNHPALKGLTIPRTGRHGPHRHAGRPRRWSSPARAASSRRRTASAARCCAPTTRRPGRKSARSTCRRRRPARR